jgi:gliding motility-associated-like protein
MSQKLLFPLIILIALLTPDRSYSQCVPCGANTFTLNFSAAVDTTYTILSQTRSGGPCCGDNNCIRVFVTLNANSDLLNFDVKNPSPSGSAFYSINCGTLTSIGTPVCVNGQTFVCITYCKPGGDSPDYVITATKVVKASPNKTVRVGCSATMTVTGLSVATVSWTSIFPGTQGQYNSFLSCTSACTLTTVTPTAVISPYIDYMVSGSPVTLCGGTSRDTVRVYIVPGLTVNITPTNAVVCSGGSPTVALTGTVSGGAPPYTYTWSPASIFTSTAGLGPGTYTLMVKDTANSCPAQTKTVTVTSITTPSAPTLASNAPICAGSTLSFTANPSGGTTYNWTGPNSFTSAVQNPTIGAATSSASGVYSATSSFSGCTGPAGTLSVTVNPIPGAPTLSVNTPICAGQTLSLTASTIAGATYNWSGPNSFTSNVQNPTISNASTAASGTYSCFVTVAGCVGPIATVAATVNPLPAAPTASANTPLCSGQTLSLSAGAIGGATYNWSGPNSFTSTTQNPTIVNTTTLASGTYSVNATVLGCVGPNGTVAVVVNQTPTVLTIGANTPLCSGQTLSLTSTSTVGATFNWSGPNSFTSNVQNPTIVGTTTLASGVYSVNATINSCASATGTVSVLVNQTPTVLTIGANSPLCSGQTLSLTSTSTVGATFNWSGPNSFTSNVQNPTIVGTTTLASGVYSVNATINSCASAAGTVNVLVNQTPTVLTIGANTPLCSGQTLSLTSTSTVGATFNWSGPNSFTSNVQNPTIVGTTTLASGVYSVNATINSCASATGTVSVLVNQTPTVLTIGANSPLCSGQTLSLTSTSTVGATFNWSGPNSFTSNVQNPTIVSTTTLASGVYSVNATINSCASATGTVNVVVNQTPTVLTIGANTPLCSGQTLSLTSTSTVGATFNWSGPNSFTSTAQNPTIAGATTLAAGVYTVTSTIGGCTSATRTINVVVNQTPTVLTIGANTPLCSGQTLSLTSTSTVGATFNWSGPNSFTSTAQNPTIVGATTLAAGVYTVTSTIGGCTSATRTINVVVNQTPTVLTIGANSPLCSGQTLSLTSTSTVGATFNWSGPNSFTSTAQNPTIAGATTLAAGVYSVNASLSGCASATGTVNVVVNQTPTVLTIGANTPLCSGQTLSLTSTSTVGATFSWSGPNSFTSTAQNPTIPGATTLAAGVYSVNASISGCSSATGTVNVVVNQTPTVLTIGANSPLCSGQTLSLTSTSTVGATFSWSGPNSFTSTAQNPTIPGATTLAAGVYSVNASISGCASATGTVNVVVNQTPTVLTIGANTPLCSGQTLSLTSTSTVGATFNWSGPNSFTSTAQNPTIVSTTTLASGIYSVNASIGGCSSATGTISVLVNETPTVLTIGANSPVCTGQTLSLTATSTVGATYNWSGPNSFTSSVQNPTVVITSTLAAGVYSVNAMVSGCASATGTVNVVVNETPIAVVAGANSPLCSGQTLSLTAGSISGATYSWSGPNSFTSTTQDPTIVGTTTLASGVYSVNATVLGCTGADGTVSVVVNQTPATPTISSNAPLCQGQPLFLTTTAVAGATYNWTGPNSFTSSVQNPTVSPTTTLDAGTYSLEITVLGCTSPTGTLNVIINPTPAAPVAGSNGPLCAGQTLSLTATTIFGATYSWNGPLSFTSTVQNPVITGATTGMSGTYTVNVNVAGCGSSSSTVSVLVSPPVAAPTASNNSPVCEGQPVLLSAGTISGATYNWFGPNSYTASTQNATVMPTTTLSSGVYSVQATIAGCSGPFGLTTVTVNPTPNPPASVGSNAPLCEGQTLFLTASSVAGATYSWTGPNSFTSSIQNPTIAPTTSLSNGVYSVNITVGGCTSRDTTINVIVNPLPSVSVTAGSNAPLCIGQTLSLTATSIVGASYSWSGPLSFTSSVQNPTIGSVPLAASGVYSVSITVAGCSASSASTVNVVVAPPVPAPTAGGTSPICEGQPIFLTASPIASATYSWSGPNSFTAVTQNATVMPTTTLSAGVYSVTANVGGCTSPEGTVSIVVNSTPFGQTIGSNAPVCEGQALLLTASSITGATYSWSGPNSFTSTAQNPTISPTSSLSAGTYSLNVTVGGCTSADSTINIVINPIPAAPSATATTPVCSGSNVNLGAATVSGATYSWTGPNSFTANIQSPTITGATTLATGVYSVNVTVLGCTGPDGTVSVLVTDPAVVNAGPNGNVCSTAPFVSLTGTVTPGYTTTWSSLGTGTVTSPNNINTTYIMTNADTTAGSITFILTASGGGCPNVTDTVVYNILPAANTNAGPNQNVCKNAVIPLSGIISGVTTTGYWTSTGTGTFVADTTASATYYQPSTADTTGNQTIFLILTSTNNGGCAASIDTLVATFINAPSAAFSYSTACATYPVQFTDLSTPTSSLATFNWDFGDAGTSTTTNPIHTYSVGGSYTVTHVVTSLNGCTDTIQQIVPVYIAPVPAFSYTGTCVGTTASFNDLSTLATGTITGWNWTFGDGGTAVTQNAIHVYTVAGTFSVTLTVTSSNGCATSTTQAVNVNPRPTAEFAMSGNPIFADETLGLTDQSTPLGTITNWNWAFGDSTSSTLQNPTHLYDDKGVFTITLSIIDVNGCTDTISKDIFVTLLPLVPTGFSPNGDTHNDVLFVKGGPFKSFYFRVYNNWGEKIFESTDQSQGWDGTYKGQECPLGAYAWILDVELFNEGRTIRKTGDVTIVK